MARWKPWANLPTLLSLAVFCSISTSCDVHRMLTCGQDIESYMSAQYGVKFSCGGECHAKLTPADARRLGEHMTAGSGGMMACSDIISRPDVKSSSAAFTDPCCNSGGSSCTHFYHYVLSESAGEICIAM